MLSNAAPTGTITAPANGAQLSRRADVHVLRARASDPEDGTLPPSAFTWRVDFHHDDHTHPHMPATSGITTGTFTIANRGETSANVFYRVILTVRDSSGLTHTSSVDVRPLTSVVRIESNVPNAQLTLDGAPITAPFEFTGVEGIIRTLGVVTPQTSGGTTYEFVSWSDGGQATHEIVTPTTIRRSPRCSSRRRPRRCSATTSRRRAAGRSPPAQHRDHRAVAARRSAGHEFERHHAAAGNLRRSVGQLLHHRAHRGLRGGSQRRGWRQTSMQSPAIALPAGGTITLTFRLYFAHLNNATSADYFRVRVVGNNGQAQTVFTRRNGQQCRRRLDDAHGGSQRLRRADHAAAIRGGRRRTGSLIEAGFDNVVITRQ